MKRIAAGLVAVLALTGCSPRGSVWFHFHTNGDPTLHAQATRIVQCETGGTWDPEAYNRSGASGLFQIMPIHAPNFERVTGHSYWTHRFDAFANAQFARWLYSQQGWRPWACA